MDTLERFGNLALAGAFGAIFIAICEVEEWMWRRRMKRKVRGLMRML